MIQSYGCFKNEFCIQKDVHENMFTRVSQNRLPYCLTKMTSRSWKMISMINHNPCVRADCWMRDYAERPSFEQILEEVTSLEDSDFCDSTDDEQFRSMQTMWRGEIQKKFVELKKMEHVSQQF